MTAIKMTPLGGLGETGALNCMIYETDDAAIVVDCGVAFVDNKLPGVNLIIPDFSFLEPFRDKLKAVVLTHGHEDHVGGLPYLLKRFSLPVYATDFTRGIVHGKFEEHQILDVEVFPLEYNKLYEFSDIKVEPVFVNHSIMDAAALLISNEAVKLLHCTDYKIDHSAPENKIMDLARFRQLGVEGLDLLLLDSTNALYKGWTLSESKVRANLLELFTKCKGRIIACLFSSNSFRVQSLLECARITGRKVALTGRSSKDYFRIASDLGRMNTQGIDLYDVEDMDQFDDSEVLVLVTGSQAEPRSVLSRISRNMFRPFKIKEGDTVVMSSRMIPGNEGRIWELLNNLSSLGAVIINENVEPDIHASGHALEDELREIMRLTQPRHFMPIHGEHLSLKRHIDIAVEEGVPRQNCVLALDGDTIELSRESFCIVNQQEVKRTFISENSDFEISFEAIRRRNKMAWNGLVAVSVIYDHQTSSVQTPVKIMSEGIFGGTVEADAREDLREILNLLIIKNPNLERDKLDKFLMVEIRHYFKNHFQIRPEVLVLVHEV